MPKDNENDIIIFNEEEHSYTNKLTNERYISVSQLIKEFSPGFDPDGSIIKKCSAKEGISVNELRKRWDAKRDKSASYGTDVHAEIEKYIKTKKIDDTPHKDIVKEFAKIKFKKGKIEAEKILFNTSLKIAGTCDIVIFYSDDSFEIFDLKTNEKLSNYSFGKYMLPPVQNYFDSTLQKYEFQMSFYTYLLDLDGYWPVGESTLLWVNPKTRKIEQIKTQYRKKDVKEMLKAWKARDNVTV